MQRFASFLFFIVLLGLMIATPTLESLFMDSKTGLPDVGVHFTKELRDLRSQHKASNDENEQAYITKQIITLVAKNCEKIKRREDWISYAVDKKLIPPWNVLVDEGIATAQEVKNKTLKSAKRIVERLRDDNHIPHRNYIYSIKSQITDPIDNNMFTWEELGISQNQFKSLFESKRPFFPLA